MEELSWKELEPGMRAELEALLREPTSAFAPDYLDALGWWLLALICSVAGLIAAIYSLATDSIFVDNMSFFSEDAGYVIRWMLTTPQTLGIPLALGIGTWAALAIMRNRGRWGFAALDAAIVVVRGSTLKVSWYANIADMETRVIGSPGKRFTVLTLKLKDGGKKEFSVAGGWAKEAVERFRRSQS